MPIVEVRGYFPMRDGKNISERVIPKTSKLMFQINDKAWKEVSRFIDAFITSPEVKNTYTLYGNNWCNPANLRARLENLITKRLEGNNSGFIKAFFGNSKIKSEAAFEMMRMFILAESHPEKKYAKTAYMTQELTGQLFLSPKTKASADSLLIKFYKKPSIMKIREALSDLEARARGKAKGARILLELATPEVAAEEASAIAKKAPLKRTAGSIIKKIASDEKRALMQLKATRGAVGEVLEEVTKFGEKVVKTVGNAAKKVARKKGIPLP